MPTICDSPESTYYCTELENRIHHEFWVAFMAWEEAPDEQKPEASLQLNKTVRQLYDFMVRGVLPQNTDAAYHVASGRV